MLFPFNLKLAIFPIGITYSLQNTISSTIGYFPYVWQPWYCPTLHTVYAAVVPLLCMQHNSHTLHTVFVSVLPHIVYVALLPYTAYFIYGRIAQHCRLCMW